MTDAPSDAPQYATLSDYLRVLRERRILIVLVTLVFAGAALALSIREEPTYVAETSLSFADPAQDLDILGTPVAPSRGPEQRAAESAVEVTRPEIFEGARERLRTQMSASGLQSRVSAQPEARTNFVVVEARSGDPDFSARLANAVAAEVVETETEEARERFSNALARQRRRLRALDSRTDQVTRSVIAERISRLEALRDIARPVEIARRATPPANPVSPRPVRNTILGLLLGLTIGIVLAFIRDSLDRRLRGSEDIEGQLDLPRIGDVSEDGMGRTIAGGKRAITNREIEAARIMRMNIGLLDADSPMRSIVVTSGLPEEGKSTVAASLAYASALSGRRTLLVECDLRRPSLASRLGVAPAPGLSDCLVGEIEIGEAIQSVQTGDVTSPSGTGGNGNGPEPHPKVAGEAFDCVTAGTHSPRPAELIGSRRFDEFLETVRERYDFVVLDTSPLLAVVDTLELIPKVDGVVLCVRRGRTTRDQARAAKAALDHLPARPTGVVVTGLEAREAVYYGRYAYGYS